MNELKKFIRLLGIPGTNKPPRFFRAPGETSLSNIFDSDSNEKRKARSSLLTRSNAFAASEQFIQSVPEYPGTFEGKGIVICAGGVRLFTSAWVCINMLRKLGCTLPIQLWHLGKRELDAHMKAIVKPLGVECVDALEMRKKFPARILNGWELKAYALLHNPFKEVLLLDADNVPVVNPEFLFELQEYKSTGAVFWPDIGRLGRERTIWNICGVPYQDEPEFESGQILVNKERCWKALKLANPFRFF